MKHVYLIGGPMGVGKTTVCQQLKLDLPDCVFLDGDWCWDANPFHVTDETKRMVIGNICHLLGSFIRCSAYENVVFCWVMHEQSIIDDIVSRLDLSGCRLHTISLTASESALRSRLAADIARGIRQPDVIGRSLARLPLYRQLHTVHIDTTGKSVQDVASEIAALP